MYLNLENNNGIHIHKPPALASCIPYP